MPPSSVTSLKLALEMKERIQRLASARRRPAHWILREAVEQYVEREDKREQFRQAAHVALYHYNGEEIVILAVRHEREAGY